ncbi:MarR family transcriptional regulator, partial [Liquorilactobacillus satsumensis]|uniref:MarR family transcriptional regulator n=1 Tax=Liquorilactobacillus satsumensis TaxID=259059 RepID=UPI0039E8B0DC
MSKLNPLLQQIDSELHRYLAFDDTKKVQEHLAQVAPAAAKHIVSKISITELDVLQAISCASSLRIKELVTATYFPQGTVSKIVNRLVKKKLVKKYHQPNNKKDVYLKLTEHGCLVADLHEQYHTQKNQQLNQLGATFNNTDLIRLAQILHEINELREK